MMNTQLLEIKSGRATFAYKLNNKSTLRSSIGTLVDTRLYMIIDTDLLC